MCFSVAPVAQLDRVLASDAKGCWFDPRRVRHKKNPYQGIFFMANPEGREATRVGLNTSESETEVSRSAEPMSAVSAK